MSSLPDALARARPQRSASEHSARAGRSRTCTMREYKKGSGAYHRRRHYGTTNYGITNLTNRLRFADFAVDFLREGPSPHGAPSVSPFFISFP
jgi:hypothetical protein